MCDAKGRTSTCQLALWVHGGTSGRSLQTHTYSETLMSDKRGHQSHPPAGFCDTDTKDGASHGSRGQRGTLGVTLGVNQKARRKGVRLRHASVGDGFHLPSLNQLDRRCWGIDGC